MPSFEVPTTVRFSPRNKARLKALSKGSGIPAKKLIEVAVDVFLDRVEKAGRLDIPVKWKEATGAPDPPHDPASESPDPGLAVIVEAVLAQIRKEEQAEGRPDEPAHK